MIPGVGWFCLFLQQSIVLSLAGKSWVASCWSYFSLAGVVSILQLVQFCFPFAGVISLLLELFLSCSWSSFVFLLLEFLSFVPYIFIN